MRKRWPGIFATVAISTAACGGSSATSPAHASPCRIQVHHDGMMAHRLACDLSDRILAIASVSGALTFMDRRQVLKGARAIGATALAALVPASVSAAQNDKVE